MSNPLVTKSGPTAGAVNVGSVTMGSVSGQYDSTVWYSGISPSNYYLVYKANATLGQFPLVFAPSNSTDLIRLANSFGTEISTEEEALEKLSLAGYYPGNRPFNNMVTDGLVLSLNASNTISYPTTGSQWLDGSGNSNNGTLENTPTFNSNGAIDFDGTDDSVQISNPPTNMTDGMSIELLIKSGATNGAFVICPYSNGIDAYIRMNSSSRIYMGVIPAPNSSVQSFWTQTSLSADRFHRVVFTYKQSIGGTAYFDAVLEDSAASLYTALDWDGVWNIGQRGNDTYFTDMNLAEMKVYNKTLSQSEILQNYYQAPIVTDGLVFAIDPGNLVSYEGGSLTAYSLTGSFEGTLNNGLDIGDFGPTAWDFGGVDDSITLSTNISLGNGNIAWTVSAWVKSTTTVNGLGQGSVASNDGSGPVYSMMGINLGKIVYWTYQGGWVQYLGVATINDGDWHHLTWVNYSDTTMDMYVDGVFDKNITNSTSGNNNPIDTIGNSWAAGFEGEIAALHIYQSKSLTASEVLQNYNANSIKYN